MPNADAYNVRSLAAAVRTRALAARKVRAAIGAGVEGRTDAASYSIAGCESKYRIARQGTSGSGGSSSSSSNGSSSSKRCGLILAERLLTDETAGRELCRSSTPPSPPPSTAAVGLRREKMVGRTDGQSGVGRVEWMHPRNTMLSTAPDFLVFIFFLH